MTLAYFTSKSDNLNILDSRDSQESEPGSSWPSCFFSIYHSLLKDFYAFKSVKQIKMSKLTDVAVCAITGFGHVI